MCNLTPSLLSSVAALQTTKDAQGLLSVSDEEAQPRPVWGGGGCDFLICTNKKKKKEEKEGEEALQELFEEESQKFLMKTKGLTLHLSATPLPGALFVLAQVPMNYLFKYLTPIVAACVHRRLANRSGVTADLRRERNFPLDSFKNFILFFFFKSQNILFLYKYIHTLSEIPGLLEQQNALCLFCGFVFSPPPLFFWGSWRNL